MISPYLNKPLRSLRQVMAEQSAAPAVASRPTPTKHALLSDVSGQEDGVTAARQIDD